MNKNPNKTACPRLTWRVVLTCVIREGTVSYQSCQQMRISWNTSLLHENKVSPVMVISLNGQIPLLSISLHVGSLWSFHWKRSRTQATYTRKETTKKQMKFFRWKTDGCTYDFLLVVFCRLNLWNCVHVLHGPHFYPFKIDSRGKRCPIQSNSSLKAGDTEFQLSGSPPSFSPRNASVLYFHPDKAQLVHTRTCTSKPVDPDTAFIFLGLVLFFTQLGGCRWGRRFLFCHVSSFILQEQEHSSIWLPICETVSGERLQDGSDGLVLGWLSAVAALWLGPEETEGDAALRVLPGITKNISC